MTNGRPATTRSTHAGPIRRFEDLEVWQLGRELAKGVFRACRTQRLRTEPILCDQMKRAVVSICSNIAEGFERGSRKQHIEFAYISKGSAGELRCQVLLAADLELIEQTARDWLLVRCERCSRMLAAYLRQLKSTSDRFRGLKFEAGDAD
ncbi:MAG: four helix bundle protein [Phycisphaerales bacterium]|nr:four helix bundle protein [Phycisphaerales bacterium]